MPPTAAELKDEWTRDLQIVRQCRGLQAQIADYGIHFPIHDLLVMRGHLRREVALEILPTDHVFPSDDPTRHGEKTVLERARETGKVSETQFDAARAILRSIAQIGVPVTLMYVMVSLKYVNWKDLIEIDRRLADPPAKPDAATSLEDAETKGRPAIGGPGLEDAATRERSLADLGTVKLEESTRRSAEMRLRLLGIPEADLRELLRETRLVPDGVVEGALATVRRNSPPTPLVDALMQRGALSSSVAEVLIETWQRRGRRA